jgi:hypothetical protein
MTSPAGAPARPKIVDVKQGDKTIVEARWYCPQSGELFHRGTIEIKDTVESK